MRSHRRPAALSAAVALAAVGAAVAAAVAPAAAGAVSPSANELLVGWVLLGVAVMLVNRAFVLTVVLLSAGLLWVAVGLAPHVPDSLGSLLQRLALAPTALTTVAAILLPRGRPSSRVATVAAVAALIVAGVAGEGWYRWAVATLGLLALAAAVPWHGAPRPRRARNAQLAIGSGLLASGVVAAVSGASNATFVANLHELVLLGAAASIGWSAGRGSHVGVGVRGLIDLAQPAALGVALGAALGTAPLDIVFPAGDGGWLDSSGQLVPALSGGAGASAAEAGPPGDPIAYVRPPLTVDGADADDVLRLLAAAGDAARLRAALRAQAGEISRSRARLESAADGERARLAMLIEGGPLATLARAADLLKATVSARALDTRLAAARATLSEVVGGLDIVAAAGGLAPALGKLAKRSGAMATIDTADDLGESAARVVWFACAEALANAAKHAAGASVSVRLDRSDLVYELRVSDDGPGGADAEGSGVAGLRERAMSIGATLVLESPPGRGTSVHLVVPRGDARCHVADQVATPIRTEADWHKVAP